jgi:hypothetical protein
MAVDRSGGPVIDPTANVIALVQANKESADVLREMHDRLIRAEINVVRETVKWIEKLSDVHQRHDRDIHKAEQEKLAALRASDEAARITEANRSLEATKVVERTLSLTAEAQARRYEADMVENNKRIAALEKASYEGAGKGTGAKALWGYLAAGVALMVTLFMAALTVGGIIVAIAYAIKL